MTNDNHSQMVNNIILSHNELGRSAFEKFKQLMDIYIELERSNTLITLDEFKIISRTLFGLEIFLQVLEVVGMIL
ncbi:hypothetical protein M3649_21245 [Ureibacillus chungkukjangi]|uniref:hypothetical protein n=1 Tax=Ureibacillus chungkukjangi TaxID=1202712 RepID=UPI002041A2E1|nr:hypothetical protein [Ureibacillus chungkukjangi]MCM3390613.1 hypothetical protein [Ureibacillus chungkukjangi]